MSSSLYNQVMESRRPGGGFYFSKIHVWIVVGLGVSLAALAGCGLVQFGLSTLIGENQLLGSAVPIEQAVNDPTLSDDQRSKLATILLILDFAENDVGLFVGDSYQTFADLDGGTLVWNLNGAEKTAFKPYIWPLPFLGNYASLGFFDRRHAFAERDRLVGLGFDTYIYEVDAFSTIGLLPDPVASSLLDRPLGSMIETVFHELLHNTVWRPDDIVFNESLANFVGRAAGRDFMIREFGEDSTALQETQQRNEDVDRYNAFIADLTAKLQTLYSSNVSRETKLAERTTIFDTEQQQFVDDVLPELNFPDAFAGLADVRLNNAFLMVNTRYNSHGELFTAIHESTGRDWPATLELFRRAAAAADPITFLESLLGG